VVSDHEPTGRAAQLLAALTSRLPAARDRLLAAAASDRQWWERELSREQDPTGLVAEANVLRYRPFPRVVVRLGDDEVAAARALLAAACTGTEVELSAPSASRLEGVADVTSIESAAELSARLVDLEGACLRDLAGEPGLRTAALRAGLRHADDPVVVTGRVELLRVLREQAISRTRHRYGHVSGRGAASSAGDQEPR
jgi:RHH-type transcriptional regulator, proline utilization regulon repressor / proline dehydrogenase / delta 1-pyrroline-5-carboxylate dehydrogenase